MICYVRQANGMLEILEENKKNQEITLRELQGKFKEKYKADPGNDDFSFCNQHQFSASLFIYIGIPSQKFFNSLPECSVEKLVPDWGVPPSVQESRWNLKELIRHLRNAIAHGNVSISPDLEFTFVDEKKGNSIEIKFNRDELQRFSQALSWWCLTKDITLKGLRDNHS